MQKRQDEDREYFTCRKCRLIVKDPVECTTCRKVVCHGCKSDGCPTESCNEPTFEELNPFVKKHLESLKFHCKNVDLGCDVAGGSAFGIPYSKALSHLKKCKSETYLCPFGCVDELTKTTSEIVGEFMNEHLEECDHFKVKCHKCDIGFARDQIDKHDCFEELKK